MSTQTDIKAVSVAATGAAFGAPTRVKGITITYASGGTVALANGSGGTTLFSYTAPLAAGSLNILFPGEGILFRASVYATLANTSVVVYYG